MSPAGYSFDPPSRELRDKVRQNVKLSLFGQGVRFVVNLGSTVVLARLLSPNDYGLAAMATAVTGIMMAFRESGLSTTTVQSPKVTHEDLSGLFWANVVLGVAVAVLCVPIGWVASLVMRQPEVFAIICAQGAVGILTSLCTQHSAIMQRRLEMRELVKRDIWGQVVGLAVGIYTAKHGWSYWSLVAMQVAAAIVTGIATWAACPWRPGGWKHIYQVKELLTFGWTVMASNLVNKVTLGIPALVIGTALGPHAAGLYNRAQNLMKRPLDQVLTPVMAAIRPALGRTTNEPERLRRVTLELLRLISFLAPLVVCFIAPVSDILIQIFYGHRWLEAAPIFTALSLFAMVEPWSSVFSTVLVATGHPGKLLRWKITSITSILLGLVVFIHWGPAACAWGYAVTGLLIRVPLFMRVVSQHSPMTYRELALATFPGAVVGLVSVGAGYGLRYLLSGHLHLYVEGVLTVLGSTLVFVLLQYLSPWTRPNVHLVWDHFKKTIGKKKAQKTSAPTIDQPEHAG